MPGREHHLTVKAAEYLGVCPNTLWNWDRDNQIPVHRHPMNGYRLFLKSDLEAVRAETPQSSKHPTGWERPQRKPR